MNNQQEAFRRFAQQLQRASQGGGGFPGGSPRGLYAGGGLVIALVAGGLALNASLFNGAHLPSFCIRPREINGINTVDGGHRAIKYTRYAS
jgi:prohibitin 2